MNGKQLRNFVVHWGDLASRLPIGGDFQSQAKRRSLFDTLETKGEGVLFQAKAVRGIYRLLPTVSGMPDTRPMLTRAFKSTVSECKPIAAIGTDNADRNQFRVFMMYIWWYLKIWELLCQAPQEVKGHVSYEDFEATFTWLKEWGFRQVQEWRADPTAAFDRFKGGNPIPNEEFCDRVVRGALRDLSSADEADERMFAIRLLQRTHPHLFEATGGAPPKDLNRSFHGAPPVPPPGQRRPPKFQVDDAYAAKPIALQRWQTQYMNDFESPSRCSKTPSAANSLAPSRAALSRARTRAPTPPELRLPNALSSRVPAASPFGPQTAPFYSAMGSSPLKRAPSFPGLNMVPSPSKTNRMVHSSSMPEAHQTLTGLDRDALRIKLERHLEMSTTGNMRNLVRVAGGLVMDESSPMSPPRQQRSTRFAPMN